MTILKYPYGARRAIPYSAEVQEYLDSVGGYYQLPRRHTGPHPYMSPLTEDRVRAFNYTSVGYVPNKVPSRFIDINYRGIIMALGLMITAFLVIFGILVWMTPLLNWMSFKLAGY